MVIYQANADVILKLKHPLGKLLRGSPKETISKLWKEVECKKPTKIFAIGDIVAANLLRSGIKLNSIIIDFKSKRRPIEHISLDNFKIVNVRNPSGVITIEAYEIVKNVCQGSCTVAVIVEGEEDLLTLPVMKFAPLGSFVVYGQPYVGIVLVTLTEKSKLEAELLLEKMLKHS